MDRAFVGHVDLQHNSYLYGLYARPYASTYFNCYLEGDTMFGSNASFIAKYDLNGNLLWVKNCKSPNGIMTIRSFVFDSVNSVFYITGIYNLSCNIDTANLVTSNNSIFLAKLDENGNCLWAKNVGANAYSTSAGTALTIDNNGAIYMAGITDLLITIDTSTITPGTFLAKFDSNGNSLWAKTKFGYSNSNQSQMRITTLRYFNNNIFASGQAYTTSIIDSLIIDTISLSKPYGSGYGLVCMDAENSNAKWLKLEGHPHTNPNDPMMDLDFNGNIYCTGTFYDTCRFSQDTLIANASVNGFVSKYDSNGNMQWVKQLSSTTLIGSFGIKALSDGSSVITGGFSGQGNFGSYNVNSSTPQDLFISRYDSNGVCLGVDHAGVGSGLSISADESNVYMTGVFPPAPRPSDTINIAGSTFINYGWEDIVFAKHDMISGISEETRQANNSLIIYANPNKGSFSLKIPDDFKNEQKLTLNIFDNNGKLIRQQFLNMNDEHPILDVYGEAKGVYTVTLSNTRKRYNGKMIVQ